MRYRVLGMILAGGKGSRLMPLTLHRSKPAVPFGGIYRIIDFVLSNFVNSGIRSIYVLTQFKSQSLAEHLYRAWAGSNLRPGHFLIPVPAQQQTGGAVWYAGTADAITQNLNLVRDTRPDLVCIFGGDHIYFMDISRMLKAHVAAKADVTIAALRVPRAEGGRFGVLECDPEGMVRGFYEKADAPPCLPHDPEHCFASMGNYVFGREVLCEVLEEDARRGDSRHDFGRDILPAMVEQGRRVLAYDFESNEIPGRPPGQPNNYWRDVGTLESYYEASLDLKEVVPKLDLYNREWPINALGSTAAPAKCVHDCEGRAGEAHESILGPGSILSGGRVRDSVLGRNVRIKSHAEVLASVLFDGVTVERSCRIRRAILDKDVTLPEGAEVGYDAEADRARGWTVTGSGLTVVPKQPVLRPVTTLDL